MSGIPHTEQSSAYDDLEQLPLSQLLAGINAEDRKVAEVISTILLDIEALIAAIVPRMKEGGRLFYLGAGTSGRLGIVDASECPPTFGVDHGRVIGLIAGGDQAIRKAVEHAEDDEDRGWNDLVSAQVNELDTVIGIAASGTTPYVVGALKHCRANNILTGCITCNQNTPLAAEADYPIVAVVGPEFVTGSTRMKAGTAQKLILNMISTSVMIQLGHVKGNKMVDMQLSNDKLIQRGTRMIAEELDINYQDAKNLLMQHGSVRKAIENYRKEP